MKNPDKTPVEAYRQESGPFVVAAETTRMPMIFTDAQSEANLVAFANDSFLALTGFTRDAILSQALSVILGDMTDSEGSTSIQDALIAGSEGTWEMSCRRSDGTTLPASVFLSPVRDEAGTVRQNFLSFIPLGDRYIQLLKQENDFRALYETAPGFIATAEGPDHRFTFANASYKKFVGRADLEGLTVAEALPEIANQGFIEILDEVYRTGLAYQGMGVGMEITDDQTGIAESRYANFVYQSVKDQNGSIVGLFCQGYDTTAERKAADELALLQAELIHLSRVNAMGTMAMTLAHELNQPLSAIVNYTAGGLRLLDTKDPTAEPIVRVLLAIDDASQRASDIIRTLRELTKRRDAAYVSFDLKSAAEECIRLVRAATAPNVEIIDRTPGNITMAADRIQIQQVVINLLRNACDAVTTSELKQVTISAVPRDDEHVVTIADTGPGVSLSAAQDIFLWGDSTKEGGMGLGLAICRTIIEAHHGRIWLEQSSEKGAEFCFSIPLHHSLSATSGCS